MPASDDDAISVALSYATIACPRIAAPSGVISFAIAASAVFAASVASAPSSLTGFAAAVCALEVVIVSPKKAFHPSAPHKSSTAAYAVSRACDTPKIPVLAESTGESIAHKNGANLQSFFILGI